jgi:hypothetical protein
MITHSPFESNTYFPTREECLETGSDALTARQQQALCPPLQRRLAQLKVETYVPKIRDIVCSNSDRFASSSPLFLKKFGGRSGFMSREEKMSEKPHKPKRESK